MTKQTRSRTATFATPKRFVPHGFRTEDIGVLENPNATPWMMLSTAMQSKFKTEHALGEQVEMLSRAGRWCHQAEPKWCAGKAYRIVERTAEEDYEKIKTAAEFALADNTRICDSVKVFLEKGQQDLIREIVWEEIVKCESISEYIEEVRNVSRSAYQIGLDLDARVRKIESACKRKHSKKGA